MKRYQEVGRGGESEKQRGDIQSESVDVPGGFGWKAGGGDELIKLERSDGGHENSSTQEQMEG